MSLMGQKEVTTFMDIPIDGSVENMIGELQKKGFKYTPEKTTRTHIHWKVFSMENGQG